MERAQILVVTSSLVVAASLVASCSSTSGGSSGITPTADAGTDGPSAEQEAYRKARETVVGAQCDILARCGNVNIVSNYGDVATCKARLGKGIVAGAPGLSFSQARADACAAGLAKLDCLDYDATNFPQECYPQGTLPDGEKCDLDQQCESGQCYHANIASAACGVCKKPAPLGGDCSDTACERRYYCARNKCVAKAKANEACSLTDKPCLLLYSCLAGKCVAPVGKGQSCEDKQFPGCNFAQDLLCNASTTPSTCVSIPFANNGETCGADTTKGVAILCRDSQCPGIEQLKKSTCIPYAQPGQPCSDDNICGDPYECRSGTCRLRDPLGCE